MITYYLDNEGILEGHSNRIYLISWIDNDGNDTIVCATDSVEKWLKHNNRCRVSNGEEKETLSMFNITEIDFYEMYI